MEQHTVVLPVAFICFVIFSAETSDRFDEMAYPYSEVPGLKHVPVQHEAVH